MSVLTNPGWRGTLCYVEYDIGRLTVIALLALALVYLLLLGLDRLGVCPAALGSHRAKLRVALATMFLLAASGRLASPETLLAMIPASWPLRYEALYVSGLFEVIGAIGLMVPGLRRPAGLGLALLLLLVFPANVNVALHNLQIEGYPGSSLYQWARLPIQAGLMWLALWTSRPEHRTEPLPQAATARAA
jgi:uncharacterized membrane protein